MQNPQSFTSVVLNWGRITARSWLVKQWDLSDHPLNGRRGDEDMLRIEDWLLENGCVHDSAIALDVFPQLYDLWLWNCVSLLISPSPSEINQHLLWSDKYSYSFYTNQVLSNNIFQKGILGWLLSLISHFLLISVDFDVDESPSL